MTRPDPSTYYTPALVLRLIEMAPPPASSSACPIRLGGDGDSLHSGSGQVDEGAGWAPRPDGLWDRVGSRAGARGRHLPGLALAAVAVAGWLALACHVRRLTRVRAYRARSGCPL